MPQRPISSQGNRKRWLIAGAVVGAWLVCDLITGSYLSATVLLVVLGALGAIAVVFARHMGFMDHPWVRQLASRPWRSAPDVLRVAARHLDDVFIITPNGNALAPVTVEVRLNPDDLAELCQRMDIGSVSLSMTEAYEQAIERRGARLAQQGHPDVYVVADDSVAPGRFRIGQGQQSDNFDAFAPAAAGWDAPREVPEADWERQWEEVPQEAYAGQETYAPRQAYARQAAPASAAPASAAPAGPPPGARASARSWSWSEGVTRAEPQGARGRDMPTVMEKTFNPVPVLRLLTRDSVVETKTSGHRAGRGNVEMVLPDIQTISREHAKFTYSDGRWWVANLGLNGLMLNGALVNSDRPLSDGDTIRWGTRPDAVESRVEIA